MTFAEAKEVIITFGMHKGKTIDQIATEDEGLKYLDWLYGHKTIYSGTNIAKIKEALEIYLADPSIQKELEDIIDG